MCVQCSQLCKLYGYKMSNRERFLSEQNWTSAANINTVRIQISLKNEEMFIKIIYSPAKVKQLKLSNPYCHFLKVRHVYHLAVYRRLTFPAGSVSPSKQAGEAEAALLSLITTDPTSLHPSFSDSHFISVKGHFHCLARRMPLKYELGVCRGMRRLD